MKRWIVLALSLILALSLAACGGQGAAQTPANDDAAQSADAATPDDSATPDADAETSDDSAATPDADEPSDNAPSDADATLPDDGDAEKIANPFTDYATYEEAETAVGFKFGVPEQLGGYDTVAYRVAGTLFEVIYSNDASSLTARKAPGGWDISGDNNQYTVEVAETLAGVDVTCWGEGDTLFLAMWSADGYSYSLSASESVDRMDFIGTVETIIDLNAA